MTFWYCKIIHVYIDLTSTLQQKSGNPQDVMSYKVKKGTD